MVTKKSTGPWITYNQYMKFPTVFWVTLLTDRQTDIGENLIAFLAIIDYIHHSCDEIDSHFSIIIALT